MDDILEGLNKEQKEAVLHYTGPLLILAGAGSGKTRVITRRIAYLIEECNVNPWSILALTFTNKAAGEMRERVDKLVGTGAEAIWVSTFHSTCVRILRRFIDTIGYKRNFTIYDTDDSKTAMKGVLKELNIDPTTKTIVFSNALDFNKYLDIHNYFKGRIRISAGIGTNLTNDTGFKPANIVMKLSKCRINKNQEWRNCIKISDDLGKHLGDNREFEIAKYQLNI
jgi:nicotinic acid phosphoribosyltransferase